MQPITNVNFMDKLSQNTYNRLRENRLNEIWSTDGLRVLTLRLEQEYRVYLYYSVYLYYNSIVWYILNPITDTSYRSPNPPGVIPVNKPDVNFENQWVCYTTTTPTSHASKRISVIFSLLFLKTIESNLIFL